MPNGIRSHLSYANVMATGAMFVALGGGAYALSGVPDAGGVYHGCVDNKTRALRVVTNASSCRKAKIIKRSGRRVRLAGESAIAWNQQGRAGANGTDGLPGANGTNGANGATKVVVRTGTSVLNAGFAGRATAKCIGNERAVGGSAMSSNTALNDWIIDSEPINANQIAAANGDTPVGWSTQMHGDSAQATKMVIAYVICASP
jgi:hypothetical protein